VLARIVTHVQGARLARQARNALDAFGHATMVVRTRDGRVVWQTPLARSFLRDYLGCHEPVVPPAVLDWVRTNSARRPDGREPVTMSVVQGARRLVLALHESTGDDEWLLVMREASDASAIEALTHAFRLTAKEGEVLYWVVKG